MAWVLGGREWDLIVHLDDLLEVAADVLGVAAARHRDAGQHTEVAAQDERDPGNVEIELDRFADLQRGAVAAAVQVVDEDDDRATRPAATPVGPLGQGVPKQRLGLLAGLGVDRHASPQILQRAIGSQKSRDRGQHQANRTGQQAARVQPAERSAHDVAVQPGQDEFEHADQRADPARGPRVEPDHLEVAVRPQFRGKLLHQRALAGAPPPVDGHHKRRVVAGSDDEPAEVGGDRGRVQEIEFRGVDRQVVQELEPVVPPSTADSVVTASAILDLWFPAKAAFQQIRATTSPRPW
jgi:hypothetical protein